MVALVMLGDLPLSHFGAQEGRESKRLVMSALASVAACQRSFSPFISAKMAVIPSLMAVGTRTYGITDAVPLTRDNPVSSDSF